MKTILSSMVEFGLSVGDGIIVDGKLHRCHSNAKDKRNKDGWYIANEHEGHYYATYGCWIRGIKSKSTTRSGEGANIAWKHLEEKRLAADIERLKKAKEVSENYIRVHTQPAESDHAYLISKGVGVYGRIRTCNNALIVPVFNSNGETTSYQIIAQNGRKRFLYNGVVAGGCFPIPGDDSLICICEGYATGASVHEATGYKVLVAFNSGNLMSITAQALKMYPGKEFLVCADNDHGTFIKRGFNPGIKAAKDIQNKLGVNFVYPAGIDGTDFNDMASESGLDAVREAIISRHTIECLDRDTCILVDDTLAIPPDLELGGLIGQGLEALEGDILQYSLPLVLTVISRAIAGKITINDVYPNIFNIKVGGTSTGKTSTDKKFTQCLDIQDFISMNDVASGPGIWRAVSDNPRGMGLFDEVSSLFMRNNNKGGVDIIAEGKSHALMDLYSRSGQSFKKAFGDAKNAIQIDYPCVSIIGNATPTIFEAIQLRDFETGLMQRFDFWMYGGKINKKPLNIGSSYKEKTKAWIRDLNELMNVKPAETLATLINERIDLDATSKAYSKIEEYSDYIVDEANKAKSDGEVGFISRRFDLSLKYALIHHASMHGYRPSVYGCGGVDGGCTGSSGGVGNGGADRIYNPVDINSVNWGIAIAEMLCNWKISKLEDKVVSGEFHKDCELFKAAIFAATKNNRSPTFKYLASRKSALKNWQPKYAENVIHVLKKRSEIIIKETGKSTLYYLPKHVEYDE